MEQKPFAMVCTPAYDGKVETQYSQSMAEAFFTAPYFGVRLTACVMGNGAFIDLARNSFVRMFLEDDEFTDCTHLFFIDSDIGFPPEAMLNLIHNCTEERPVTAGVYPRRQLPIDYPYHFIHNPEIERREDQESLWIDDYWLYCDRVPTGFLCIHRSVIERMEKDVQRLKVAGQEPTPRLFYTKIDEEGRFVGEDYCWCDDYMKLHEAGEFAKPISVQMDIDFSHGRFEGNLARYLEKAIESYREHETKKPRKLGDRRKSAA